jgi:hypothetical protein
MAKGGGVVHGGVRRGSAFSIVQSHKKGRLESHSRIRTNTNSWVEETSGGLIHVARNQSKGKGFGEGEGNAEPPKFVKCPELRLCRKE